MGKGEGKGDDLEDALSLSSSDATTSGTTTAMLAWKAASTSSRWSMKQFVSTTMRRGVLLVFEAASEEEAGACCEAFAGVLKAAEVDESQEWCITSVVEDWGEETSSVGKSGAWLRCGCLCFGAAALPRPILKDIFGRGQAISWVGSLSRREPAEGLLCCCVKSSHCC